MKLFKGLNSTLSIYSVLFAFITVTPLWQTCVGVITSSRRFVPSSSRNEYLSQYYWAISNVDGSLPDSDKPAITWHSCAAWCARDLFCAAFALFDQSTTDPSLVGSSSSSADGNVTCVLSKNPASRVETSDPGWKVYLTVRTRGFSHGCMKDASPRFLGGASWVSATQVTPSSCMDYCLGRGYVYAGVEASEQCFCGTAFGFQPSPLHQSQCQRQCNADPTKLCGGTWALELLETGLLG